MCEKTNDWPEKRRDLKTHVTRQLRTVFPNCVIKVYTRPHSSLTIMEFNLWERDGKLPIVLKYANESYERLGLIPVGRMFLNRVFDALKIRCIEGK